jgi:hypothetical protein
VEKMHAPGSGRAEPIGSGGKKFVKNFRESISLPTLENVGPGILGLISEVISMVSYMEQGSGCYLDETYGK